MKWKLWKFWPNWIIMGKYRYQMVRNWSRPVFSLTRILDCFPSDHRELLKSIMSLRRCPSQQTLSLSQRTTPVIWGHSFAHPTPLQRPWSTSRLFLAVFYHFLPLFQANRLAPSRENGLQIWPLSHSFSLLLVMERRTDWAQGLFFLGSYSIDYSWVLSCPERQKG